VQMGLLGALLTFSDRAFYAPHWLTTGAWGLSPLEDQQVGGMIMWAPGAAVYLVVVLVPLSRSRSRDGARAAQA
jgi:putative membrane protein